MNFSKTDGALNIVISVMAVITPVIMLSTFLSLNVLLKTSQINRIPAKAAVTMIYEK